MIDIPLPVLGSFFVVRDRSLAHDFTTGTNQFLEMNPNRWAIYVWNPGEGATVLRIHPNEVDPAVGGDDLTTSPTFRVFTFRDLGALVQLNWGFEVNPLGLHLGVVEVIYQPPAGGLLQATGGES